MRLGRIDKAEGYPTYKVSLDKDDVTSILELVLEKLLDSGVIEVSDLMFYVDEGWHRAPDGKTYPYL